MMYRALFTLWVAVCAALPAFAAELQFSGGGEVEYDDNVFRREEDEEDDILFRLRPGVRIYEDRGDDLNFSAGYTAPIEFSVDNSDELNEVDHVGDGRFTYHVNDRIEFFGSEHYAYVRSTLRDEDNIDRSNDVLLVNDERDRVKINNASLGGLYKFSPRTVARVEAASRFFDSTREDRARVWSVGGTADLNHALTLKHQVGAGLGYTFQDFDDRQDIPGSQTHTYQLYGSWRWLIDPTVTFDLRAGPAYLTTDQDDAERLRRESLTPFAVLPAATFNSGTFLDANGNARTTPFSVPSGSLVLAQAQNCPLIDGTNVSVGCAGNVVLDSVADAAAVAALLDPNTGNINVVNIDAEGESDETVTGFIEAVIAKDWTPILHTALRYSREQGEASGLGGTVIVDAVSLSNTWDFADRWSLSLRGDYIRRESAFDIAQTFDEVINQPVPGGTVPVATRTGRAFNATQDVDIDTDRYGGAIRVTHRLFRTTSLYGQVRYDRQESNSNTLGADSDFENILATFGVRHVFEPITLW